MSRYALAALVNAQRANNYILTMVHRDPKRSAPQPPEQFPVPGVNNNNNAKPGSFAAIAASMLAAQRRKKELMDDR